MVDNRYLKDCKISKEMSDSELNYWFDFKQKKFLHNVDTFYYSVKFVEDFTADSDESNVKFLRRVFDYDYEKLHNDLNLDSMSFSLLDDTLQLVRSTFAKMYTICLHKEQWFDIFFAPKVPKGAECGSSVTCEMIVQIRSYMLWIYGYNRAFEKSYEYVKAFADMFGIHIAFVQENRIDYCWHSNYLSNPERFFSLDNFYKMRVDRFHDSITHTEKDGSDGYIVDYVAVGKRSDKIFIRIYLKTKEVIEENYKPWFFYIWFFNGLISRYDLFVYEEMYKRKSWHYMDMARLQWYSEYGSDDSIKSDIKLLLDCAVTKNDDDLRALADSLTPKVNLIMNVEYQTMRKHTKSYQLLNLRDYAKYGPTGRIYKYMDNHKIIVDYLTEFVFRLSDPAKDGNKSRRGYAAFWDALRKTKLIDCHMSDRNVSLTRDYSRRLDADKIKTRIINSIITMGIYNKGVNDDDVMQDVADAIYKMNDNDIHKAMTYKLKRSRQFNAVELPGVVKSSQPKNFKIVDLVSGEFYTHSNIDDNNYQDGAGI